jgi:ASC-1-like (ASCH) protein
MGGIELDELKLCVKCRCVNKGDTIVYNAPDSLKQAEKKLEGRFKDYQELRVNADGD